MTGDQSYKRLPGRTGLFIRHSLWIAPDHLLRVRAHPFAQEYRRYYFKDIQALVLTESPNPAVYFLYGFAAFFGLLCVLLFSSKHQVWGTLLALPTILLLYIAWRIPECVCRIQTRVSADWLPSLGKLRSAHRSIARIQQAVEGVQGQLEHGTGPSQAQTAPPTLPSAISEPELRPGRSLVHWVLFALLLIRAVLTLLAAGFSLRSVAFVLVADAIGTAAFVSAIVAASAAI